MRCVGEIVCNGVILLLCNAESTSEYEKRYLVFSSLIRYASRLRELAECSVTVLHRRHIMWVLNARERCENTKHVLPGMYMYDGGDN